VKKSNSNLKETNTTLIKKFRNFTNKITVLIFSALIVACCLEAFLREFPSSMPFPNKWNYLHHYKDLSRLFRGLKPHNFNEPKIIAIGDSFTRGAEVAPNRNWVALLNNNYGYNIFNLAVGGSSNVEQWVLLKGLILPESIEHVLLAINTSDIQQNIPDLIRHASKGDAPFYRRAREATLLDSGAHGWEHYDSCQVDRWYQHLGCYYYRSYLYSSLYDTYRQFTQGDSFQKTVNIKASNLVFDPISKRYKSKNMNFSDFASEESWFKKNTDGIAATVQAVKKIQKHLILKNITLEVVYLPVAEEIYYSDWAKKQNIKTTQGISAGSQLEEHILKLGLPYKNLTPPLRRVRKSEAPLYLPLDVHPNEKGHKIIAELINKFLKSRDIK
jgi:lysophospholipase L1-like esterase